MRPTPHTPRPTHATPHTPRPTHATPDTRHAPHATRHALAAVTALPRRCSQSVDTLNALDVIFVMLFTVEYAIKLIGLSIAETWSDSWNRLDLVIIALSYVSIALKAAFRTMGSSVASLRVLRLLRLLRLLRAMRAFGKISGASLKTRVLVATFAQFGLVVVPMVLLLVALSYFYAILGMEFLSDALDSKYSKSYGVFCSPMCPSFANLPASTLTLFQLLIAANWSPVLDETINASGWFWGPTFFFISYITLCHVFMLSLLAALVLEVYAVEMDKAARETREDKMHILCHAWQEDLGENSGEDMSHTVHVMLSEGVRRVFRAYDLDGNGSLHADELHDLLSSLGSRMLSEEDMAAAMTALDSDGSGLVDYDEFLPWWRRRGMEEVFHRYAGVHAGCEAVDRTELGFVMRDLGLSLTASELADALTKLDTSGDGYISLTEYVAWFDLFDMQLEFGKFDADGSGTVNKREFLKLTCSLGLTLTRKERDRVFVSLDRDGSGVVTFAEFHPWFKAVRANTKAFVLGKAADRWEEELFLKSHELVPDEREQKLHDAIAELADELADGHVPTREELFKRLCPDEVPSEEPSCAAPAAAAPLKAAPSRACSMKVVASAPLAAAPVRACSEKTVASTLGVVADPVPSAAATPLPAKGAPDARAQPTDATPPPSLSSLSSDSRGGGAPALPRDEEIETIDGA
jgi:calcium-binding protein CML